MERAVEIFAVVNLGIVGLSHVLAPGVWVDFFVRLRDWGHAGVLAVGFMSLFFGSIVAAFYNVWSGSQLVLTLVGWAQVAKALVYFCLPAIGMRWLQLVDPERRGRFVVAGAGWLAIVGVIVFGWL